MRTVIVILCITSLSAVVVYSQDETDGLNHSVTIEIPNLFLKTISVSYNYKLNDKYELRINPKISLDWPADNLVAGLRLVQDPFWYYDSYTIQIGLSRNFRTFYIEPMLSYKYASFDNRTLQTHDSDGDSFDVYQKLSRQYKAGGVIFRSGIKLDKDHFRFNFFYGIGYHLRYYKEVITREYAWGAGGLIPHDYPITSNYWKDRVLIHVGFEVGYRFATTSN
jgi:hypothetical protein